MLLGILSWLWIVGRGYLLAESDFGLGGKSWFGKWRICWGFGVFRM
jgi:hypothetical protein